METFLDPAQNLHLNIPDVVEIIEICAVSSRSQSDTERTVKRVKEVERERYKGKHDEQKAQDNRRGPRGERKDEPGPEHRAVDRANEEVFISENGERNLNFFPSEAAWNAWTEGHLPSVMSTIDRPSTTMQALDAVPRRHQYSS